MRRLTSGHYTSPPTSTSPVDYTILAPESWKSGVYGPKTDIWAFGLLLYEIYVGVEDHVHPLQPLDEHDLKDRALNARLIPAPLPASCPLPVQRMCAMCFEHEPARRASAKELAAIVEAWRKELG